MRFEGNGKHGEGIPSDTKTEMFSSDIRPETVPVPFHSVPAHVEMMGLIGMGNNPMVGATVACAVAAAQG